MHVRVSIAASDLVVLTTRTRHLVKRACALRAQAATLRADVADARHRLWTARDRAMPGVPRLCVAPGSTHG